MSKKHNGSDHLTAKDLMTRDVVTVSEHIPAAEAAQLLMSKSISGVPVVDDNNQCVGIFSAADFTRRSRVITDPAFKPEACPFQVRHRGVDGREGTLCTLPAGLCPLQRPENEEGHQHNLCCFPHEIVVEWQSLQPPLSPADPVRRWMTAPAITVQLDTAIRECAARMVKAKIHRLIVVDENQQVQGVLSSMDLLSSMV